MTLRCLGRTDEAELRGVEFAWGEQFARLLNRSGKTTQVANTREIRETVHNLTDSLLVAHLAAREVARG